MNRVLHCSEAERLNELAEYDILDTLPESSYDDIATLAASLCRTPMSCITMLDANRLWLKARVGLNIDQFPRDISFCQHVLQNPDALLIVHDTARDARFSSNPLVTANPGIRFYTGAPLVTSKGVVLGALCVLDHVPRELDATQLEALEALARQAVIHIENRLTARKLQERERHFQAFFDRSLIGMGTVSPERHWTEVNDSLCRLLGYCREELLDRPWDEWVVDSEDGAKNPCSGTDWTRDTDDFDIERSMQARNGGMVHVRLAFRSIRNANGLLDHFVVLAQDMTGVRHSEERLWRQANFDALTGLPNRRMLQHHLEQECLKAARSGSMLGFLFIDLDRFKEVNDTLSHEAGDHILQEAAERIASCVRQTDMVARLGADEFLAVIGPLGSNGQLERVAQNVLDQLALPFHPDGQPVYLSASIGLTVFSKDNAELQQMVAQAEQAMAFSKQQGRNGYRYFTPALQESAVNRLQLLNDLHGAIEGNQFQLVLQPIVDLWTNRIAKAEVLLRWNHPLRGAVSPATFIPIAEESGYIVEIGSWVLKETVRLALVLNARYPDIQVSVNMSPIQFKVRDDLFDSMYDTLQQAAHQNLRLVVEITEGLLLHAESRIIERLNRLRSAGIEIAIDDFGTGYSSLAYLKKFDIDYLKIDRSFIQQLEEDPDDMALSETIIMVAHKLGLKTIAEGVETAGQRTMLANAGCDCAQGYLFSPGVSPDKFLRLLEEEELPGNRRGRQG